MSVHKKDKCPICGESKDVRSKLCMECHKKKRFKTESQKKEKRRNWVKANRDKTNKAARKYWSNNLELCRARTRKHRKENPESYRKRQTQYIRRRRSWVQSYKHERGCKYCPENDPRCLDFHHRNPKTKMYKISNLGCSFKLLKKEIMKCDIVCANCHRKRTWKRRDLDERN